jgi:hypothetical protein
MPGRTNDTRRILLLGRGGQTGWELERSLAPLGKVLALGRGDVDLADGMAIRRTVRDHRPALIVNAAAYNADDGAEQEEPMAIAVNGEAPGILSEEARRLAPCLCITRPTMCSAEKYSRSRTARLVRIRKMTHRSARRRHRRDSGDVPSDSRCGRGNGQGRDVSPRRREFDQPIRLCP